METRDFKVFVAVHLFLFKDGKILLQRRNNPAKHAYLKLGVPAGHLEAGENVNDAIVREMKEELGIDLKEFKLVQVMNLNGDTGVYDAYFYVCEKYEGELKNNEPESAKTIEWHDPSEPLEDMIPYEKYALDKYLESEENHFTFFGW